MAIDKIAVEYFKHRLRTKSIQSDRSKYNVHTAPVLLGQNHVPPGRVVLPRNLAGAALRYVHLESV